MGDPDSLSYFVDWTIDRYGGVKFALIIGGHGSSWGGCCPDAHSGGDDLSLPELRTALLDAQVMTGETLDIIGFNSCIMQYTEVVYALRGCAEIAVASEELEWAVVHYDDFNGGWPFDLVYEGLTSNPLATPEEFATIMVEAYRDFWIDHPIVYPPPAGYDVEPTLSAWSVPANEDMAFFVNRLGNGLILGWPYHEAAILNSRALAEQFPSGTYNADYIDLRHFVELLDASIPVYERHKDLHSGITYIQLYIDGYMTAEWHDTYGQSNSNANGIGIYFPHIEASYDPDYADIGFSQEAPNWDLFLRLFHDEV